MKLRALLIGTISLTAAVAVMLLLPCASAAGGSAPAIVPRAPLDLSLMSFKDQGAWYFLCTAPYHPCRIPPHYATVGPPPPQYCPPPACGPVVPPVSNGGNRP